MNGMNKFIKLSIVFFIISFFIIMIALLFGESSLNSYTHYIYGIAGSNFGTGLFFFIRGMNKK